MLEKLRLQLASPQALLPLAILGLVYGVLVGIIIVVFRTSIEFLQAIYIGADTAKNYASLSPIQRLLLPTLGGAFIGLILQFLFRQAHFVGVVHVMERLAYHQGYLSLKNAFAQFIGTCLSLASGHSVGREGPSVHLGAANGSLLGQ